jgi:hypothetical protein
MRWMENYLIFRSHSTPATARRYFDDFLLRREKKASKILKYNFLLDDDDGDE